MFLKKIFYRLWLIFFAAILCLITAPAAIYAQSSGDITDVFIDHGLDPSQPTPQPDTVYFVSARTGLSSSYPIDGAAETVFSGGVLYRDRSTGQPRLVAIDGTRSPIAFMAAPPVQITGWAVSSDGQWIAWVESKSAAGSILSDLIVARADDSQKRVAVHTSSASAVGLVPIAISRDGGTIVYSRQVTPPVSTLYSTAADVSVWNAQAGIVHLPGEPLCACVAAGSADGKTIFRLDKHFAAHVVDRATGAGLTIAPPASLTAMVAGDALFAPGGGQIAYSYATSGDGRMARYGLVLIDTTRQAQTILIQPGVVRYQPIAFAADSILLAAVNRNGTFRIALTGSTPIPIAADSYLGTLNGN